MATTTAAMSRRKKRRGLPVLSILSGALLAAAGAIFILELVQFSQQDNVLAPGVIVAGVDVSGLSERDAVLRWQNAFQQDVVLYYGESPIILKPSAVGFQVNSDTMLASALETSETTANFWSRFFNYLTGQPPGRSATINLAASYQESLLTDFLLDIADRYDRPAGQPGYDVVTLTVYEGVTGSQLDVEAAKRLINTALYDPVNRVVNLPIGDSAQSRPNLTTLRQLIVDYLDSEGFIYDAQGSIASIFIMDLQTGEEINLLGDVAMTAASTTKVPIMIDFYRVNEDQPTPDEAYILANSLLCSRNSSSNTLIQLIGGGDQFNGLTSITQTLQQIGTGNTFLIAPYTEGVAGQQLGAIARPRTQPNANFNTDPDPFNQTTAEDLGTMFAMIYDCANYGSGLMTIYENGEFTQRECRQMLELMSANDLQRLLQGGLPMETRISHKNGWLGGTVGDAGIVYSPNGRNYVISVFLWEDTEFQDFERLWPLVEGISRATWNYFNPDQPLLVPRDDLPRTAQDCEGNYLPPAGQVNLDDIWSWREGLP
ncbi:MAG: class A beta-lactamase-related serine hydrolase [Anaerolineae bacterium]|jgi:beta-lactamase class A|nr:class A beta-lactamase-related serine hydrolase [Anaerolineae bacterium]